MINLRPEMITVAGIRRPVPDRFHYSTDGQRLMAGAPEYVLYTNKNGEGLFFQEHATGNTHQILGTTQFRAASLDQFKRRLRAWLAD